ARHALGADDGAATRLVLDHDGLTEQPSELFRRDAGAGIGRAAGSVGHDQADRTIGIGLRSPDSRNKRDTQPHQGGTALHYLLPNFAQGGTPCEAKAYPVRLESAGPDMPGFGMLGATRFRPNGTASGSI